MAAFLLSLTFWQMVQNLDNERIKAEIRLLNSALASEIQGSIHRQVDALIRMAARWEAGTRPSEQTWKADAKRHLQNFRAFTTLQWIDSSLNFRWKVTTESKHVLANGKVIEAMRHNMLRNPSRLHDYHVSPLLKGPSGDTGFIITIPLFVQEKFDGFLEGIFDLYFLIPDVLNRMNFDTKFTVNIRQGRDVFFSNDDQTFSLDKEWMLEHRVKVLDHTWILNLGPRNATVLPGLRSRFPDIVLSMGFLLTLLLTLATFLAQSFWRVKQQAEAVHQDLQTQYTELEETQTALEKLSHHHRQILNSAGEGIYGLDREGNTTFVNPAGAEMLGYKVEELLGLSMHTMIHHSRLDGSAYPREECPMYAAFRDGQVHQVESEVLWRKDGTHFEVEYTSNPIWEDGQLGGAVVIFQNITDRKQAEKEIQQKNQDLETLIYVISHDLGEPLRAIQNFSQLVRDRYIEHLEPKAQDYLERVIRGTQRMSTLLQDVLILSRAQRLTQPEEFIETREIVDEALKQLESKIEECNAKIHITAELPIINADKRWAVQAVFNLIANALKFTINEHPPDITIEPFKGNETYPLEEGLVVHDRGPGIASKHRERIFQIFQRLVEREVPGTGAGLAIVRQVALRHGGHAWVEEREGGGSSFYITFGKAKIPQPVAEV